MTNVLIVGADGRGSFEMRGLQLGEAMGARVTRFPRPSDFEWADVVVLVKHAATAWGDQAKRSGKPLVWDVLDVWRQPNENQMPIEEHLNRIRKVRDEVGISMLIAATQAMAEAIGGVYLPHHCRQGLSPAPVRTGAIVVGYEGQPKYLGSWRKVLEQACARLGMTFVVNPSDLRTVDVVVAFRGERWDGEVCRQWKSGVKFVNAVVAGRPVLSQPCAGFTEIPVHGVAIEHAHGLAEALEVISQDACRQSAYEASQHRAANYSLPTIAQQYRAIVERAA